MSFNALVRFSHGVSQNTYHFVWVTKYRYPVFKSLSLRKVVRDVISKAAEIHSITVFECRVLVDHVHLFVRLPKTISVSKALQLLKGNSSRFLRSYVTGLKKYKAPGVVSLSPELLAASLQTLLSATLRNHRVTAFTENK